MTEHYNRCHGSAVVGGLLCSCVMAYCVLPVRCGSVGGDPWEHMVTFADKLGLGVAGWY
jgi:hypothetical protein